MGNIHVKLFEIWTSGSGGMPFKEKVYGQCTTDGRTDARQRLITIAHIEHLS